MVTSKQKYDFIRWFLSNVGVKNREENWFLNSLLSYEERLEKFKFVEYPNGLDHVAYFYGNSKKENFQYKKNGQYCTNIQDLFGDIKHSVGVVFYLHFDFDNKFISEKYLSILEDENPKSMESEVSLSEEELIIIDGFQREMTLKNKENYLLLKIDESLDLGNKENFIRYTEELNLLMKRKNEDGMLI